MNIDAKQVQFLMIQNQLINEGQPALAARLTLDFTAQNHYDLDMLALQQQGRFDKCQSIYIDNANGGSPVTVTIAGSGMQVTLKAGFQGWFNVICPNPIKMSFDMNGGQVVTFFLTDVAIPGAIWASI